MKRLMAKTKNGLYQNDGGKVDGEEWIEGN